MKWFSGHVTNYCYINDTKGQKWPIHAYVIETVKVVLQAFLSSEYNVVSSIETWLHTIWWIYDFAEFSSVIRKILFLKYLIFKNPINLTWKLEGLSENLFLFIYLEISFYSYLKKNILTKKSSLKKIFRINIYILHRGVSAANNNILEFLEFNSKIINKFITAF